MDISKKFSVDIVVILPKAEKSISIFHSLTNFWEIFEIKYISISLRLSNVGFNEHKHKFGIDIVVILHKPDKSVSIFHSPILR